jgi:signal transduction histidine kinase
VTKGQPYQLEKRYVRKDGSPLWVNVSASPMRNARGQTQAAIAVIVDTGDRKEAQAMLENANALLESRVDERTRELVRANEELQNQAALRQRLEGEILEIAEREQRHLGLDLHDSLCQHLTATAFLARAVALRLRDHRVIEVKDLEKIAELINEGVTEARTIARGLHPVEMDPAGLANALRALLHGRSKIPYRLDVDEELSIPNPKIALHLYRIASEAIINANKHARARELVVRVRSSRKGIELSVTDDGVGVSPKARDKAGMGFHIMDYRARLIGARLEIKLVNPHGTRVVCYVPRK